MSTDKLGAKAEQCRRLARHVDEATAKVLRELADEIDQLAEPLAEMDMDASAYQPNASASKIAEQQG